MSQQYIEVRVPNVLPLSERGIAWNGNYPYIPGTGGIKHYLLRSVFEKRFINDDDFDKISGGRSRIMVQYPGGYDDIGDE